MRKITLSFLYSLSLAALLIAPTVSAQGLVKCDETNPGGCTLCMLFATIKAVYDFATQAAIILAVGFIMYGGYEMLIAGTNPVLYKKGRDHIFQAFLGLAIVLGAWFIVDIFMRALTGAGDVYGAPWRTLDCK